VKGGKEFFMSGTLDWVHSAASMFGTCTEDDEFFHFESIPSAPSVTETYYFGFWVPGEKIQGWAYFWLHPNLKVITGGVMIYQGFKSCSLAADYYNLQAYLDFSHINLDNGTIELPNGLTKRIIKPLAETELVFRDASARTEFHLLFRGTMPPAMRSNNKHFEQNMAVEGELTLRGRRYSVNCHSIRDRSWGEERPESVSNLPPYDWYSVSFSKDFAMNLGIFDDLTGHDDGSGQIVVPPELFVDGWVFSNGNLVRIKEAHKKTLRAQGTLVPLTHTIEITDTTGNTYRITGDTAATCNWNIWPNALVHLSLTRWECEGQSGWGEDQEVQWHEFIRLNRK
jgi:hypothetical protein